MGKFRHPALTSSWKMDGDHLENGLCPHALCLEELGMNERWPISQAPISTCLKWISA